MHDEDMIAEGLEILNIGIDHYPEFVFSKLLIYADEDVDSPEFQNAFTAIRDNMKLARLKLPSLRKIWSLTRTPVTVPVPITTEPLTT